ncbi:MAG: hypothetical protein KKB50_07790 [Planctomycetes bacterium]|nr:hypothetical protein [Planctomycetota bacterium]
MFRQRSLRAVTGLTCLVIGWAACPATAETRDAADLMPADTLLFVGWSQLWEPDPEGLEFFRSLLRNDLLDLADNERAVFGRVVDLIALAGSGAGGIGLLDLAVVDGVPDVQLAAVIDVGERAPKLADELAALLRLVDLAQEVEETTVAGVEMRCLTNEDATLHLFWGTQREHFIIALGSAAAEKVVTCLSGDGATLADNPELVFDRKKVKDRDDDYTFCCYVDFPNLIAKGKRFIGDLTEELPPLVDQAIEQLGLNSLRSKYVHVDHIDGRLRLASFAHVDGPYRGLLTLWKQKPLSDDDLKIVPQNAYWMSVFNLDLAGVWSEAKRIVAELAPDAVPAVDGALAMSAQMLGFSPTEDLLPAFGDTWAVFDAPDHGGILLTGTVLVAEVKDPEGLQAMLARLIEFCAPLAAQGNLALKRGQMKHNGHTIDYVVVGRIACPVAPAWGFVGDRCVFALFPQTAATAMKQVDSQTRGPSILDNPNFKAVRELLPRTAQSVGYLDSVYLTRLFYPLLLPLQTMGLSMTTGTDTNSAALGLLSPLPERVAGTTNSVSVTTTDDDGVLFVQVGDASQLTMAVGGVALATSTLLPSLSRARMQAKRTVSMANLRGLGQGCFIYAQDHDGKFPESPEQLVSLGMATEKMLNSPLDLPEVKSYVYIAGQKESNDSRNVLAYEQLRDDEGTCVLFLDGHSEFMPLPRFKQILRETYQRLERADEFPAELLDSEF